MISHKLKFDLISIRRAAGQSISKTLAKPAKWLRKNFHGILNISVTNLTLNSSLFLGLKIFGIITNKKAAFLLNRLKAQNTTI
jgi:hypothetical protein